MSDIWRSWEFDPGIVGPLVIAATLYTIGSKRHFGLTQLQMISFWAGWVALVIALVSPLHRLGDHLFSAHMVQHEILMIIAAPLLVLSRPLITFLWALPIGWRRKLGRFAKWNSVQNLWLGVTAPITAWWIHALCIWGWHAPPLFNATLSSDLVHAAQHLSFFLSALLFWWALLYAHGAKSYGGGVLYVFTTALYTGVLGALLTFAPHIWYSGYSFTTEAYGLTPLEDQQIGGLIMWVPGSVVYIVAGLGMFAAWIKESDRMVGRASGAD